MQRKFIVTADDYGLSPIIDDAVQSAIARKLVTAVSVFPNVRDENGNFSVAKAKILKNSFPHVSVGMHFTITSGEMISGAVDPLTKKRGRKKDFFKGVISQNPDNVSVDNLEKELQAQIDVFEKDGVEIDFFSDHHGLLSITNTGSEAMMRVVKRYMENKNRNIPIRNPMLSCGAIKDSKSCLDRSKMYSLTQAGTIVNEIRDFLWFDSLSFINFDFNVIDGIVDKVHNNGIHTPDYFIEHFYGKANKGTLQCIVKDAPSVRLKPGNPINSNIVASEILVHLAIVPDVFEGNTPYLEKEKVIADYGLSTSYLRHTRGREYATLIKELPKLIKDDDLVSFDH